MIRTTLEATQASTFAVELPDAERNGFPTPAGTGFFVSPDGFFVTAAHVIANPETRELRSEVGDIRLQKEVRLPNQMPAPTVRTLALVTIDYEHDFALLKADLPGTRQLAWFGGRDAFRHLIVSMRRLEEAEPVYAFGYPLSEQWCEDHGGMVLGGTRLSPRTTTAIVSSTIEIQGPVVTDADLQVYVLDRALNYGNSGGPIIATSSGHVHAFCSRFQPVYVPQAHLKDAKGAHLAIMTPSLYGIVISLANPSLTTTLAANGVPIRAD